MRCGAGLKAPQFVTPNVCELQRGEIKVVIQPLSQVGGGKSVRWKVAKSHRSLGCIRSVAEYLPCVRGTV